jgi:chromosomal replication initiator protein
MDSSQWPEVWEAVGRILEQTIVSTQLRAWIQPLELVTAQQINDDSELHIELGAQSEFGTQWIIDHHIQTLESAFSNVLGRQCKVKVKNLDKPKYIFSNEPQMELRAEPYPEFEEQKERRSFEPSRSKPQQPQLYFSEHENLSDNESLFDEPQFSSSDMLSDEPISVRMPKKPSSPTNEVYRSQQSPHPPSQQRDIGIDPRYIFDSFVVGASNQFAHATAVAVAERPGSQYNPLFLYSPPGLGKTHLLHAIGNHILIHNPKARVCYISAENFMNDLVESLQRKKMTEFRAKYRQSFDLLLIDDIQFIAGREATEEEFFHTFNALYGSKRQIVLSSDRPPKNIERLEERVRTRFEWGLVADIQPPEIETRIAILKSKAERDDIYLPDDVANFIATYVKQNVRELEGILIRLQAQASLTGAEISLEMAKRELHASVPEETSKLTVETIQNVVCKHFGIRLVELKGGGKTKSVALPRQVAMYLARKYTGMGYKEIGQSFGGKDHSTIMHACKKIETAYEGNHSEIRHAVEEIQNLL